MRVLLSTIGSRGDVQPLAALAMQLKQLDAEPHLCVPPDFREWLQALGLHVTPIGPEVRPTGKVSASAARPTPEQIRQMKDATVATQFEVLAQAAEGCDAIVAATALQVAARSIAEVNGIPYVFVAYCPAVIPSAEHAPPPLFLRGDETAPAPSEYPQLWARDAERFNEFAGALNAHRAKLGLSPVSDVRAHILGERPWLAADETLAPWPEPNDSAVWQTGAWILDDDRALPVDVEEFLAAGDPPVYFGFGSIRATDGLADAMIESARAMGRRAIVSRGWAELAIPDGVDCLTIDEVNLQALFPRVAAVVHHGGAGTTTTAARAGVSQVVVPQMYDQHYWAQRVQQLGVGVAHAPGAPTRDSLAEALRRALHADVTSDARFLASRVRMDGAHRAASRLAYCLRPTTTSSRASMSSLSTCSRR
jgi:vancomycin aglycone glucosyltransferase